MDTIGNSIRSRIIISFILLALFSVGTTLFFINFAVRSYRPEPLKISESVAYMKPSEAWELITSRIEEERALSQRRLFIASVILLSAQIIVAVGGSMVLAKKIISPLEELNALMKDINVKMLYKQVQPAEGAQLAEIEALTTSFNAMMTRLNAAFASQKEFVENASHEIKTPLTVIKANLESVLLSPRATKSDVTEAIKTSIASINFLDKLTEDLLLLSLVEKNQMSREKIDVQRLMSQVIAEGKTLAKHRAQQVTYSNALEGEKIVVEAHQNLLHRALSNIIENASKYSPEHSTISVSLKRFKDDSIRILVNDQGPGIPKEFLKKIFIRFYRVDKSRSRQTGGTGLGLSITKEIIRQFKGRIRVLSTTGGTTFIVTLPTSL